MVRESAFWNQIYRNMRGRWDATRHEDHSGHGIPDVSYGCRNVNGWIELKKLDAWPAREKTVVQLRHFTGPQRAFLIQRGRSGNRCFLFLRVQREYLLIPSACISLKDTKTKRQLIDTATILGGYWAQSVDWDHFTNLISK